LLAFDASTPRCVIAVGRIEADAHRCVASHDAHDRPNQVSSLLAPWIGGVLLRAGIGPDDLAAVACGRGPGTFTGTRVALSTAKGLCVGLQRDLVPVSTLAAVAASANRDGLVAAWLDARRGEVYGGLFRCDLGRVPPRIEPVGPERCDDPRQVLEHTAKLAADQAFVVVGPGVQPYADLLGPDALPIPGPSPEGLWRATVAADAAGDAVDPAEAMPVYLRQSYAELGVNKPKRRFTPSPFV
jgi:tRNA threonylcarbamoyl adenosine modification protein YeaZ